MQKLYGYVDENRVETKGRIFIGAVVVLVGDSEAVTYKISKFRIGVSIP